MFNRKYKLIDEKYASCVNKLCNMKLQENQIIDETSYVFNELNKKSLIQAICKEVDKFGNDVPIPIKSEIVGYKLTKEKYNEAANTLTDGWWNQYSKKCLERTGYHFSAPIGQVYDIFKEAGVLDLWFEPVYSILDNNEEFMDVATNLSIVNVKNGIGGPFGAVVVLNGIIIGKGSNSVAYLHDPTAHAEIMAIRDACELLQTFDLSDCVIYTSCEPCPMCLGAIYWAKISKVYFANTKENAEAIGFSDKFIYDEIETPLHLRKLKMIQVPGTKAIDAFKLWELTDKKIEY